MDQKLSGYSAPDATRVCGNWTVHEWLETFSTNDLGRHLAPWSIAQARVQTGGRGRMNRKWHADSGGLWVSFVVPLAGQNKDWGPLPLIAGLALLDLISEYGYGEARLRWPNDLLIGDAKLAGILVERPAPDKAVIGIGINILNDIASRADQLQDPPARLCDLFSFPLTVDGVLNDLARLLEIRFLTFADQGLLPLMPDLAKTWGHPRPVVIETCHGDREGLFIGIDEGGHPRLRFESGEESSVDGAYITRMREIKRV